MIDAAFVDLAQLTSTKRACALLGKSRATHYRRQRPKPAGPRMPRSAPPNKLTAVERATVLATLHHESFADKSVAQVWATLLDEGSYLCSESTMYRILREAGGVRERRRQAVHPPRTRPELVADAPGQVRRAEKSWSERERRNGRLVREYGWGVTGVLGMTTPDWAYSIGLWHSYGSVRVVPARHPAAAGHGDRQHGRPPDP